MVLAFGNRASTRDIDALVMEPATVRAAAARVAAANGLPPNWLNDGARGFASGMPIELKELLQFSNLRIVAPPPAYILAMKCIAARVGLDEHDKEDAVFLIRLLNLHESAAVLELVAQYYPADRIPAKPDTLFRRSAMSFSKRPSTLAEIGQRILDGADAGAEVKDFLHEFQVAASPSMFSMRPPCLAGLVENGDQLDAYLQALAVYLCAKLNADPPEWTRAVIALPKPWFASPGPAIRNYLLMSSPAPFRMRNLFIDEDSLRVA